MQVSTSRSLAARQSEVAMLIAEVNTTAMGSLLTEVSRHTKINGAGCRYDASRVLVSSKAWRSRLWTLRQVATRSTSQDSVDVD